MAEKLSEEAMCRDLRKFLETQGWIVYPEVSDIDLVAVPQKPDATGLLLTTKRWHGWEIPKYNPEWAAEDRVAIQAKLAANAEVLIQALDSPGCTWRYVAVRRAGAAFIDLAERNGVGVLVMEEHAGYTGPGKEVWRRPKLGWRVHPAPRRHEVKRPLQLPKVVTDLPAGAASPSALTQWREKALLMCHLIRARAAEGGGVTTEDFRDHGLSPTFWIRGRILKADGSVRASSGRPLKRYVIADDARMPDRGWEKVRDQLVAAAHPDIQATNTTEKKPLPSGRP